MLNALPPPAIVCPAPAPGPAAQARPHATAAPIFLERGSDVVVELSAPISSKTAHIGDEFTFRTVEPLIAAGHVLVPRGTSGTGIVSDVSAAAAHSKSGFLILEARELRLHDGTRLQVAIDRRETALKLNANELHEPWFGRFVPMFGTAFGAFSYLKPGKDVAYQDGVTFVVYTVDDAMLAALPQSAGRR